MKKLTILLSAMMGLLPLTSISAHAAYGTPFEGWGFVQEDWQLVCDNTLTCRAAGYSEDGIASGGASILLTVIPKQSAIKAQLMLQNVDGVETSPANAWLANHGSRVSLYLNNKNYGVVELDSEALSGALSTNQTQQLLAQARQNTKIEFRSGQYRWYVSDSGLAAVLLKLDEIQGRVGTPLALVSKKNPNRQTPKAAKATPVIKKAISYSDDKQQLDPAKLMYFQKNINKWIDIDAKALIGSEDDMGDCELVNPKTEAYQRTQEYGTDRLDWTFTPVDATHTLASHLCWQGAYNEGYGYWLIDKAKPSHPQLITTMGNEYDEGEIWATHKDRGIGDCWNRAIWVWDGKTFTKSEDSSTGLCRGFAGGAWDLPTYVSDVISQSNK